MAHYCQGPSIVVTPKASPSAALTPGWVEPAGEKDLAPYHIIPLPPLQTNLVLLGPCCQTVSRGNLTNHGTVAFPRKTLAFLQES